MAGGVLSHSHELLDRGSIKYALIDGVTALELAISDFANKLANSSQQPAT